jgi:hypothetical protein
MVTWKIHFTVKEHPGNVRAERDAWVILEPGFFWTASEYDLSPKTTNNSIYLLNVLLGYMNS